MKPTTKLRHVWREINDGNGTIKILVLQQLWEDESFLFDEKGNKCDGSEWRDVEIERCA